MIGAHARHTATLGALWLWTTHAIASQVSPQLSAYLAGSWLQVVTAAGVAQAGGLVMLTWDVLRSQDHEPAFARRVGTTIAAGLLVGVSTHLLWEHLGWSSASHVLALLVSGAVGHRLLDRYVDRFVDAIGKRIGGALGGRSGADKEG